MPEIQAESISQPDVSAETNYDLDTIGIEFEYPVGGMPSEALRSRDLRDEWGRGALWELGDYIDPAVPTGEMTSDHVGAEITSSRLPLHTDFPELWYAGTIAQAEDVGYPFAATGFGQTTFGLHMHMSELPREKAEALYEMCVEPWMRVFVCTSISSTSADPWRHGGVRQSDIQEVNSRFRDQYVVVSRHGDGHYEWRMPEPMETQHFMCVMHFLRTLEVEGVDAARDYAKGLVEDRDDRLTAIKQYRRFEEDDSVNFPSSRVTRDDNQTDPEAAEYMVDLMS